MDFKKFKEKYQKKEVREYPHKVTPTPLVSVMVQTFQHKNYIKDCLDAILKQETDFPYEILLGEDFSSDGTREICIEYAKKFPEKIRLFLHHPENKIKVMGITTGNFNALYNFYSANGKKIAFCEGDDLWRDPNKLQKHVDFLKLNSRFVMSFHSFVEVNREQQALPQGSNLDQPEQDIDTSDLKRLAYHPLLSTICFRNLFKKNLPDQMVEVINVDSFLLSYLGNFGSAGYLASVKMSLYRRHLGGIWGQKPAGEKFLVKLVTYEKLVRFYRSIGDPELISHFTREYFRRQKMLFSYAFRNYDLKLAIRGLKRLRLP